MSKQRKCSSIAGSSAHQPPADEHAQGAVVQPQPLGVPSGAPPSNTARDNCKGKDGTYFKPLRWGVDSLYLSYGDGSKLLPGMDDKLRELKTTAQAFESRIAATAQLCAGTHIFEVKDKGAGLFPYILEDGSFHIKLARATSKSLPMAHVKVSSNLLATVKPEVAETELKTVLEQWAEELAPPKVSRIDIYVDFVTNFDMEGWDRHAWVTKASSINSYSVDGHFSGWSIGMGGMIAARLYDKTLEIEESGKEYLKHLWFEAANWDPKETVWRLEFQFKRQFLDQMGLLHLPVVLGHLNGLWSYAMTEWLKLTLPNHDDQTRSRWPIHPLWAYLSSIDWEVPGGPLDRFFRSTRAPSDRQLGRQLSSALTSFMAARGILDMEVGIEESIKNFRQYLGGESFLEGAPPEELVKEKVQFKARQYNTILNEGKLPHVETPEEKLKCEAEEYRKQSDGE